MMVLLQWPRFSRSPSRSQIPGAMSVTAPGWASVRVTRNAMAARMAKPDNVSQRSLFKSQLRTAFSEVYTYLRESGGKIIGSIHEVRWLHLKLLEEPGQPRALESLHGRAARAGGVAVGHDVDGNVRLLSTL